MIQSPKGRGIKKVYLNDWETPGVTITANCLVVPTRRNDDPKTKHPKAYVSLVANVTNASFCSAKKRLLKNQSNFRMYDINNMMKEIKIV